ncbi:MAG: hypothetical protein NT007_03625 [Candidatus Kapabacteria bacterium]|nr:hypothetical protein [Candidatus Kapabacteria bacterium]
MAINKIFGIIIAAIALASCATSVQNEYTLIPVNKPDIYFKQSNIFISEIDSIEVQFNIIKTVPKIIAFAQITNKSKHPLNIESDDFSYKITDNTDSTYKTIVFALDPDHEIKALDAAIQKAKDARSNNRVAGIALFFLGVAADIAINSISKPDKDEHRESVTGAVVGNAINNEVHYSGSISELEEIRDKYKYQYLREKKILPSEKISGLIEYDLILENGENYYFKIAIGFNDYIFPYKLKSLRNP